MENETEKVEIQTVMPEKEEPKQETKPEKSAARKERIPLGRTRLKLTAPKRPGFHRHWINDVGGRLEEAQSGGYQFVMDEGLKIGETALGSGNQDLGNCVSRIVGTLPDGKPQRAYLMEIEEEYYQQDQVEKQKRLDVIDAQIKGGTFNPENDNDMKRYVPSEGISIK